MKTFRKYLIDLNEKILNNSFTKNRITTIMEQFKDSSIIVKFHGNKLNNNDNVIYRKIIERQSENNVSRFGSYVNTYYYSYSINTNLYNSTYDMRDMDMESPNNKDLEIYDVLILTPFMTKSDSSYTLVCIKNFFGKKVYLKYGFKKQFADNNCHYAFGMINKEKKQFGYKKTDLNLNKEDVFNSLYYFDENTDVMKNNGIVLSLFNRILRDHVSDNLNGRYNGYNKTTKKQKQIMKIRQKHLFNIPGIYGRIKLGEEFFFIYTAWDLFNIVKRIKDYSKETKIIYDTMLALFTDFDKMSTHQQSLVKKMLGSQYSRMSKPVIKTNDVTVKMIAPLAYSKHYNSNIRYNVAFNFAYHNPSDYIHNSFKIISSKPYDQTSLFSAFNYATGSNFHVEDYDKFDDFKILEFEHGYVVLDKQKTGYYLNEEDMKNDIYFIKTPYGLSKANYDWKDNPSDGYNGYKKVKHTFNLLLDEYNKYLTKIKVLMQLTKRSKKEVIFGVDD